MNHSVCMTQMKKAWFAVIRIMAKVWFRWSYSYLQSLEQLPGYDSLEDYLICSHRDHSGGMTQMKKTWFAVIRIMARVWFRWSYSYLQSLEQLPGYDSLEDYLICGHRDHSGGMTHLKNSWFVIIRIMIEIDAQERFELTLSIFSNQNRACRHRRLLME